MGHGTACGGHLFCTQDISGVGLPDAPPVRIRRNSGYPCNQPRRVPALDNHRAYGALAHLGERCVRIAEVAGSFPVDSTKLCSISSYRRTAKPLPSQGRDSGFKSRCEYQFFFGVDSLAESCYIKRAGGR